MVEVNIYQEFRLKNVGETRNYFLEEIEQNELMHKKVWTILNYIEHLYFNFWFCFFDWYFYKN